MRHAGLSRRAVLRWVEAGAAGGMVAAIAACASSGTGSATVASSTNEARSTNTRTASASAASSATSTANVAATSTSEASRASTPSTAPSSAAPTASATSKPLAGTLAVWSYSTQQMPASAIAAFEQLNPGVKITQEQPAGDFRGQKFIVAAAGGSPPDLMHLNLDYLPMYVEKGLLAPISNAIQVGEFGDVSAYLPTVRQDGIYKGETYFLAHRQSVNTSIYNPTIFTKAGIAQAPRTWDEVTGTAQRLTTSGGASATQQVGLAFATDATTLNSWFNPLLWQAGGELFAADGAHVALDQPPAQEALQFITNLVANQHVASEGPASLTALEQGHVGVYNQLAQSNIITYRQKGMTWMGAGPVWQGKKQVGFGSLAGWVVPKGRQVDLATRFLAFSLQPNYVRDFLAATGFLPVRTDIAIDYFAPQDRALMQQFANQEQFMHYDILHPSVRDIMPLAAAALLKAVKGQSTVLAALQDATQVCNAYLAQHPSG